MRVNTLPVHKSTLTRYAHSARVASDFVVQLKRVYSPKMADVIER